MPEGIKAYNLSAQDKVCENVESASHTDDTHKTHADPIPYSSSTFLCTFVTSVLFTVQANLVQVTSHCSKIIHYFVSISITEILYLLSI